MAPPKGMESLSHETAHGSACSYKCARLACCAVVRRCVLLPHVPSSQITRSHNEYTVSGSLQITVVSIPQYHMAVAHTGGRVHGRSLQSIWRCHGGARVLERSCKRTDSGGVLTRPISTQGRLANMVHVWCVCVVSMHTRACATVWPRSLTGEGLE